MYFLFFFAHFSILGIYAYSWYRTMSRLSPRIRSLWQVYSLMLIFIPSSMQKLVDSLIPCDSHSNFHDLGLSENRVPQNPQIHHELNHFPIDRDALANQTWLEDQPLSLMIPFECSFSSVFSYNSMIFPFKGLVQLFCSACSIQCLCRSAPCATHPAWRETRVLGTEKNGHSIEIQILSGTGRRGFRGNMKNQHV